MTQSPADATTPSAAATTLPELSAEVAALSARVHELESQLHLLQQAQHEQEQHVSDEVLLAICAAVAAYLGKRARVRQVHLRRGSGWVAQGRSAIQQSHAIPLIPR